MKLSLSLQTPEVQKTLPLALLAGSLDEKLRKAADYDADGVELITTQPGQLDPAGLKKSLVAFGLEAAAVSSGGMAFSTGLTLLNSDPDRAREAENRLLALIAFAAEMGAPVVTIGSFRGRAALMGDPSRDILADILRRSGNEAGKRGVRLAIEPLNRYEMDLVNTAAEGMDFLKQVDQPAVGLLLDTFHVNIEESSWTEPFRRVMEAGRLFHVHVADNNRLSPGEGLIDFRSIAETLQSIGYAGYLSAELLPRPTADLAAQKTIACLRQWIPPMEKAFGTF